MKNLFLSIVLLGLTCNSFSQKHNGEKPNDMVYVPQGECTDGAEKKISVSAFWMSNEITNAEFKKFVNYVKQHPDSSFYMVDLKGSSEKQKLIMRKKYSEILSGLIDTTKLPYPDYYSNPKYNEYPVVGVSFESAQFYCMWKTELENKERIFKGQLPTHDYMLPFESQWTYAASFGVSEGNQSIQPAKSGKANKLGLYNLSGNVSELTVTPGPTDHTIIIKGKSWATKPDAKEIQYVDFNAKENYLGFRIVQSALMAKK